MSTDLTIEIDETRLWIRGYSGPSLCIERRHDGTGTVALHFPGGYVSMPTTWTVVEKLARAILDGPEREPEA